MKGFAGFSFALVAALLVLVIHISSAASEEVFGDGDGDDVSVPLTEDDFLLAGDIDDEEIMQLHPDGGPMEGPGENATSKFAVSCRFCHLKLWI